MPKCQREQIVAGEPYPKTCERCGLFGPCYQDAKEMTPMQRIVRCPDVYNFLKSHSVQEYGVWEVFGEDTSDGGMHSRSYCPPLGIYEGKLEHVLEHAASLNDFWTYGQGGKITMYAPPKIVKIDDEFLQKKKQLTDIDNEIARLEEQRKKLTG